ncbi:MAG: biopolymer transporter ExbD [Planctomycetales bacterium]|nr:biopolymer transporter ExbD [Planctomycetales bacterium]
MPLKTSPLEEPSLNITSLLDIILTIVMFFMVSTTFSQNERQTEIQVPTVSDNAVLTGQPDEIVVNVAIDGQMQVSGKPQTVETLSSLLQAALTSFPNQAVVIRGDGRCEYQRVMDAFSACKQAGVRNISVAHLPRQK